MIKKKIYPAYFARKMFSNTYLIPWVLFSFHLSFACESLIYLEAPVFPSLIVSRHFSISQRELFLSCQSLESKHSLWLTHLLHVQSLGLRERFTLVSSRKEVAGGTDVACLSMLVGGVLHSLALDIFLLDKIQGACCSMQLFLR